MPARNLPPRRGKRTLLPSGTLRVRRHRRQSPGHFRLHKPQWIDPYPWIDGTNPEKRIFAALMQKHIYFVFQGQVPELEAGGHGLTLRDFLNKTTAADKKQIHAAQKVSKVKAWQHRPIKLTLGLIEFIPDFVLPEYKVILDPFSPFHHSRPDSVVRDERKVALYNALGYEYYHMWVVAPGVFVLDEAAHVIGRWKNGKYLGSKKAAAPPHRRTYGAIEMLDSLPLLLQGPKYPLIDQRDITAKRTQGYRIGAGLGAGASGVALANYKRRKPPKLTLKR